MKRNRKILKRRNPLARRKARTVTPDELSSEETFQAAARLTRVLDWGFETEPSREPQLVETEAS